MSGTRDKDKQTGEDKLSHDDLDRVTGAGDGIGTDPLSTAETKVQPIIRDHEIKPDEKDF